MASGEDEPERRPFELERVLDFVFMHRRTLNGTLVTVPLGKFAEASEIMTDFLSQHDFGEPQASFGADGWEGPDWTR
jgi:hypothetical protein